MTQTDVSNRNLPTKVFILKKEEIALSNFIAVRSANDNVLNILPYNILVFFFSEKKNSFQVRQNI